MSSQESEVNLPPKGTEKKEENGQEPCQTSTKDKVAEGEEANLTNETEVAKGEDDSEAVTMVDVLQEETELEEDAAAVLGSADDQHCTYFSKGYMARQAIYACLTCTDPKKSNFEAAGICLACSYHCHEGHDLVELYTKRKFRCDCGNKKFPADLKCKLEPEKKPENVDNNYNQNFKGLYCTCHRPYPDPEDPVEDEMIQCIVCEDWYHGRHLEVEGGRVPKNLVYYEMVCVGCARNHQFLMAYKGYAVEVMKKAAEETTEVKVTPGGPSDETKPETNGSEVTCPLKKVNLDEIKAETLFFREKWRAHLCRCEDCSRIYQERELEYLTSEEDTVHFYEAQSKKEASSQYENGMKALSEMDRVKQAEAVSSYNKMKSGLMDYLKKFAENKKVVREEDIQEFFAQMKSNKKQRVE